MIPTPGRSMLRQEESTVAKKKKVEPFVYVPPAPNPPGCTCAWRVALVDGHQVECPMYVAPTDADELGLVQAVTLDDGSCQVFHGSRLV